MNRRHVLAGLAAGAASLALPALAVPGGVRRMPDVAGMSWVTGLLRRLDLLGRAVLSWGTGVSVTATGAATSHEVETLPFDGARLGRAEFAGDGCSWPIARVAGDPWTMVLRVEGEPHECPSALPAGRRPRMGEQLLYEGWIFDQPVRTWVTVANPRVGLPWEDWQGAFVINMRWFPTLIGGALRDPATGELVGLPVRHLEGPTGEALPYVLAVDASLPDGAPRWAPPTVRRPTLGFRFRPVEQPAGMLQVVETVPDTPAAETLRAGDLVRVADAQDPAGARKMLHVAARTRTPVGLMVLRAGHGQSVEIRPVERVPEPGVL